MDQEFHFLALLFTERQVGSAITLAGAQVTIQAVHQAIQMQQQAQVAQMMQSQYMSYSQLPDANCTLRCASSWFIPH